MVSLRVFALRGPGETAPPEGLTSHDRLSQGGGLWTLGNPPGGQARFEHSL